MNGLTTRTLSDIHLINHAGAHSHEEQAAHALSRTKTLQQLALELLQEAQSLNDIPSLDMRRGIDFYEEVKRFEVDLIQRALTLTHGNQVRAARLLKLKATTLNSKVKHYDIKIEVLVGSNAQEEITGAVRNTA